MKVMSWKYNDIVLYVFICIHDVCECCMWECLVAADSLLGSKLQLESNKT